MSRPHKFQTTEGPLVQPSFSQKYELSLSGVTLFIGRAQPGWWISWNYPKQFLQHSLTSMTEVVVEMSVSWCEWGTKNYLLLAKDMAKVDGPLSVVKVFTQIWTSQVHFLLLLSSADVFGYSCVFRSRPTRYSSSQFQWTKWIYNTTYIILYIYNHSYRGPISRAGTLPSPISMARPCMRALAGAVAVLGRCSY